MKTGKAKYRYHFESYGVSVVIESNSLEIFERAVAVANDALLGSALPARSANASHLFRIEERRGVCGLYQDGKQMVADKAGPKFWKFFDSLVRILVAENAKSVVFLHAGAVGWRGKGLIFPGNSFQGKTTLVAELVKRGADYYSDEYAVLDKDGFVHPFARRLSMRNSEGTIRESPIRASDLGGRSGIQPLPVGVILFTRFEKGIQWTPGRLSSAHGVVEMIPQTIPIKANTKFVLKVLERVATGAVILKGDRGEAADFAGYFLDFVDNTTI